MRTFVEAATGFPTFFFTVALVVVAGFWLLVAVGATGSDCFDEDIDADAADAWGLGGVPVAVAFTVLTVLAWSTSLGAGLLIEPAVPSGAARVLSGLAVLVAAAVAAWRATRLLVRPLHRLFPDERGPSRTTA